MVKDICLELGIKYSENSRNVVSFDLLNTEPNPEKIISTFSKGILFYFVPEFGDREDIVWYYPLFRVVRNKESIDSLLSNLGAKKVEHYVLSKNLRAVFFENDGKWYLSFSMIMRHTSLPIIYNYLLIWRWVYAD